LGCEFLNKEQIKSYYPQGFTDYSQIIQDKHRSRWKIGQWTDDTDQFLCVLDSFLDYGTVNKNDIAKRLYLWFKNGGMGIGNLTYNVFRLPQYTVYPEKAAKLIWKMKLKDIAPNGALMRNSIIPAFFTDSLSTALDKSEEVCKLTHYDPRCVDSCKIQTTLLHTILNGNRISFENLLIISQITDNRTSEYLKSHLSENIDILELDSKDSMGYTLKAVSSGIWAYYNSDSFEQGLLNIINQGGDADTNGCISGAILGAKFGFDSIPEKWIKGLLGNELLEKKYNELIKIIKKQH